MSLVVLWVLMSYALIGCYQRFGKKDGDDNMPPKLWYPPAEPHDVIRQKTMTNFREVNVEFHNNVMDICVRTDFFFCSRCLNFSGVKKDSILS